MIRLIFILILLLMVLTIGYSMTKKVTFKGLPVKYSGFMMYISIMILLYIMFTELGKLNF